MSIREVSSEIGDLETTLFGHVVGKTAVIFVILTDKGETQLSTCGIVASPGRCCFCRRGRRLCKSERAALLKSGILNEYKIGFTSELPKLKKLSPFRNQLFMLLP